MTKLLLVAVLLFGCAAPGATPYSAPNDPAPAADTSWVPAGFSVADSDPSVAWHWTDHAQLKCTYSDGSCWGIVAVAHNGCPSSLYIELSILDASGSAIGYTNDVAGAVQPMQQAKLTFDTFEEAASKARVTKVSCY